MQNFTKPFIWVFVLTMFSIQCCRGQKFAIPDSLKGRDYAFFIARLNGNIQDSAKAVIYAKCYLELARNKKAYKEMMYAYKSLVHFGRPENRIVFADSMIFAAGKVLDPSLLGSAYLTKGIVHFNRKEYRQALSNYLIANDFIAKTSDEYLRHKIKFHIGQIKYYLAFYDEAIDLLQDCVSFYSGEGGRPYRSSLHSLGLCYNRVGKYNLCSETNALGIQNSVENADELMLVYFKHSEAVNMFFLKRYAQAIPRLKKAQADMKKIGDLANENVARFYTGKCYLQIGEKQKAVALFDGVIAQFRQTKYLRPDLLEAFKLVADYYEGTGNLEKQLEYLNAQIEAQDILTANYKYLSSRVSKEFDTAAVAAQRDAVARQLDSEKKGKYFLWFTILLLVTSGIILSVMLRISRLRDRKKFRKFRDARIRHNLKSEKASLVQKDVPEVKPEIVKEVLMQLNKFELARRFLTTDINLKKIAEFCGYNETYVSKIILSHKGKKPQDYIYDLRIDYILERLDKEPKLRKYSQKALADEAGFTRWHSFNKAFIDKTGMSLSIYLKGLG